MKIRVGFGYDVHAFVADRELWLGGIRIEHSMGLQGHSDADVMLCWGLPICVISVIISLIRLKSMKVLTVKFYYMKQWSCFVMPAIRWVI